MMFLRTVVVVALSAVSCFAQAAANGGKDTGPARLAEQTDKIFAQWDSTVSPGCALSVMKDGHIVYKRGYGMADLDHGIPITPETVFHVASISKQFTATAILLLAAEGKLSLQDEVRKYVTELPHFGTSITIEHLFHHTSGLRDQWDLLGLAGWRYSLDLITDDDVLGLMSHQKDLNFPPGEKHLYCNTGYTLLGQVVKRVSGQSLREFTTDRIFKPLHMDSTHFRDDHAEIVKNIAYGYVDASVRGVYRQSVTNFDTVGATSLLTTVEDLARWDENFYNPAVGGPELVQQQLQRGKLNSGEVLDYAAGLVHGKYRGLVTVDHGGSDAGYRADLLRFPEQHFSVACLCNKAGISPSQLNLRVADIYLAKELKEAVPTKPAVKSVAVSPELLSRYVGLYWKNDDERLIRIALASGKLTWSPSAAAGQQLTPIAENQFQPAEALITFNFDRADSAWRLSMLREGQTKPDVFDAVVEPHPTIDQLQVYAGSYRSDEIDPIYRVVVEDGGLVLNRLKAKPQKLGLKILDHFQGADGNIHFQRDPSGKVVGFLLNASRVKNLRFKKVLE